MKNPREMPRNIGGGELLAFYELIFLKRADHQN